jgi:hypothetical protein
MLQEKVRPQHHSEKQSAMSLGIPNWSCSFYCSLVSTSFLPHLPMQLTEYHWTNSPTRQSSACFKTKHYMQPCALTSTRGNNKQRRLKPERDDRFLAS